MVINHESILFSLKLGQDLDFSQNLTFADILPRRDDFVENGDAPGHNKHGTLICTLALLICTASKISSLQLNTLTIQV
eukprot:g50404.t1